MHSGKKDRERARRKVVYDRTHIVSYRRWGSRSVGKRVRLLALDGRNAELAGGLSISPCILCPVCAEHDRPCSQTRMA